MNEKNFQRPQQSSGDVKKPTPVPSSPAGQKPVPQRAPGTNHSQAPVSGKRPPAKPSPAAAPRKAFDFTSALPSLTEKRKAYDSERNERLRKRELYRIKRSVRKRVSGKPDIPNSDITVPGILGKFAGKAALLLIIIILVSVIFVGGTGIGILVGYISTATEIPNELFTITEQTSYIYDSNGTPIATLTGTSNINRELVPYSEVSHTYIDEAFMAIEDRSFETNIGIDPRRIISAVVNTVTSSGDSSHGGSTITQQTIKMLTGDDEVSYQRKVQEWYRAVKLTEQLSKSEIMSLYLNLVPMGNNYVGIQSAAKAYFGKEASQLNLAECALLAGIPKSPSSYNPRTELGRKNAQRRQRVVLQAMLDENVITARQFETAMNFELVYNQEEVQLSGLYINSYFEEYTISQVTRDLMEKKGYSENVAYKMVMNGGLQIYTSQDTVAQQSLDQIFLDENMFQQNPADYVNSPELPEAGVILLDNQNGTIVAMQGGFGPKRANLVLNRAANIRRSPGSSIKPLAVYGPGLELDILTGATIIKDEKSYLDPQNPTAIWPTNAYNGFLGNMNVIDCVKRSNNVPAVKALNEVGVANAKYFLKQMGIDLTNDPVQLSLGTGGLTYGTSPLRLANAFMTFPNGGLYSEAKSYTKVLDSNGTVLLEHKPDYTQVFDPEAAYMMTSIMEDVLLGSTGGTGHSGTARAVGPISNAEGQRIASSAKTGTTNSYNDEWIVLQTPYYTSVGWYGFDNRIKQTYIPRKDLFNVHFIVGDFMKAVHAEKAPLDWVKPTGIIELSVCTVSGQLATSSCGGKVRTIPFKAGNPLTPTEPCGVHSKSGAPINFINTDRQP